LVDRREQGVATAGQPEQFGYQGEGFGVQAVGASASHERRGAGGRDGFGDQFGQQVETAVFGGFTAPVELEHHPPLPRRGFPGGDRLFGGQPRVFGDLGGRVGELVQAAARQLRGGQVVVRDPPVALFDRAC